MAGKFGTDFRRFFFRGLAAVLPTVLTIGIIIYVFSFVHQHIGQHINTGFVYLVTYIWSLYDWPGVSGKISASAIFDKHYAEISVYWSLYLWWVGFVGAIIAVYIFGRFVASFVGRAVWKFFEILLHRLPVVRQIYPNIKQVTDFLLSESKLDFSRVVAVEYPRKGVWSMGLVTGSAMRVLQQAAGEELLTIFIPSSPTPVTGYTITVRRSEVVDLPISIDEAIRFTVSGGVLVPSGQQLTEQDVERTRQLIAAAAKKERS